MTQGTTEWYEKVGEALKEYRRAERFAAEWAEKLDAAGKRLMDLGAPVPTSTTNSTHEHTVWTTTPQAQEQE